MKIKMVAATTGAFYAICEFLEFAIGKREKRDRPMCATFNIQNRKRDRNQMFLISDVYVEGMYELGPAWITFTAEFVLTTKFEGIDLEDGSQIQLKIWSNRDVATQATAWLEVNSGKVAFSSEVEKKRFEQVVKYIEVLHSQQ